MYFINNKIKKDFSPMHQTSQSFLKKKEYAPWADSVDMADDKSGAFLRNHEWGLLFHNNVYVTHHTLPP